MSGGKRRISEEDEKEFELWLKEKRGKAKPTEVGLSVEEISARATRTEAILQQSYREKRAEELRRSEPKLVPGSKAWIDHRYRYSPEPRARSPSPTALVYHRDIEPFSMQFNEGCIFADFAETHVSHHPSHVARTFESSVYWTAFNVKGRSTLLQDYKAGNSVEFRAQWGPSHDVRWKVTSAVGPGKKNVEHPGGCYYDLRCCCWKACRNSATPSTATNVQQMYLRPWR